MDKNIIDLDKKIIELLSNRSKHYIDEIKQKRKKTCEIINHDRNEIIQLIKDINAGPIPDETLYKIFTELLIGSASVVEPVKVSYLGPEGTFSNLAAIEIFGESSELLPARTISDIFHEVEVGNAIFGVVPIENNLEGGVTFTMDEFLETDLLIISEKFMRISICLLSKSDDLGKVKKVYAHPQPLGQCKDWLRSNLPNAEIHQVDSTSAAAMAASKDKKASAIASQRAADLYNLNTLAQSIEDSRQNFTRFFVIGKEENKPTGNDKTSIICAVKDKPGALLELLKPFRESELNMTKIESRPDKKKMWQYNFFIDFQGHRNDEVVKETLIKIKDEALFIKILGSYPSSK